MQRRKLLVLGGAALTAGVAGCSELESLVAGNEYEQGEKESLLIDEPQSDWPDDLNANHDFNENFDRCFLNDDETMFIFMSAEIFEEVDGAESSMERSRASASDPRDYPIADDAWISDDGETATLMFRHSNAVGQVLAARISGLELAPDRNRASRYGEYLFEHWQE